MQINKDASDELRENKDSGVSKCSICDCTSLAFLLEASPVQLNTFPVCARGPTSGGAACVLINTQRRSLVELRWRHVGEEAGI